MVSSVNSNFFFSKIFGARPNNCSGVPRYVRPCAAGAIQNAYLQHIVGALEHVCARHLANGTDGADNSHANDGSDNLLAHISFVQLNPRL